MIFRFTGTRAAIMLFPKSDKENYKMIQGSDGTPSGSWILFSQGTAAAAQVLSGYTFSSANGVNLSGSMTNRGAVTSTLSAGGSYTIPAGYHNGSGKVSASSLSSQTSGTATAARILSGYTAWVNGSKLTGTLTYGANATIVTNIQAGCSWNPGTLTRTCSIPSGSKQFLVIAVVAGGNGSSSTTRYCTASVTVPSYTTQMTITTVDYPDSGTGQSFYAMKARLYHYISSGSAQTVTISLYNSDAMTYWVSGVVYVQ